MEIAGLGLDLRRVAYAAGGRRVARGGDRGVRERGGGLVGVPGVRDRPGSGVPRRGRADGVAGARADARPGGSLYNALHRIWGPLLLGLLAAAGVLPPALLVGALVWGFHVFFDRALGYGLRTRDGFQRA